MCEAASARTAEGAKTDWKKALWGCVSLEQLVLGDAVEEIAEGAFTQCESLTSIELPVSVHMLGKEAFKGCIRLKNLTIPGSVQGIPLGMAQSCKDLRSVCIEPGVQKIAGRAFKDCPNLRIVEIPSSVKKFGAKIFDGCGSLTICCEKGSGAEKYALENHLQISHRCVILRCEAMGSAML